mmetsp:Transcript_79720/g.221874  ORF Transcript_79720/g.221874 Transcript_79720/m.221874 type:complete len:263 (-) Transcript_79720:125-913(-)|eukprot:CAMPEP_0117526502 /NCGR_PEP_ID=MMETSP0784-20121206/36318_1 /TAXON_ID=39447 /ORGANISM="" /LENGTH=262 /DNA_ID=CAMNT_0005322731 /DNA_START=64 /DNA_END=852 /DNA_ORIENTATION=-
MVPLPRFVFLLTTKAAADWAKGAGGSAFAEEGALSAYAETQPTGSSARPVEREMELRAPGWASRSTESLQKSLGFGPRRLVGDDGDAYSERNKKGTDPDARWKIVIVCVALVTLIFGFWQYYEQRAFYAVGETCLRENHPREVLIGAMDYPEGWVCDRCFLLFSDPPGQYCDRCEVNICPACCRRGPVVATPFVVKFARLFLRRSIVAPFVSDDKIGGGQKFDAPQNQPELKVVPFSLEKRNRGLQSRASSKAWEETQESQK